MFKPQITSYFCQSNIVDPAARTETYKAIQQTSRSSSCLPITVVNHNNPGLIAAGQPGFESCFRHYVPAASPTDTDGLQRHVNMLKVVFDVFFFFFLMFS